MALRFCRVSNLTSHAPATRPEIDKRSRREREGDRERDRKISLVAMKSRDI